jgi:alkylation response protein AidB-like acyl-CoA dehydrogenase
MTQQIADRRDVDFVLHEQMNVEAYTRGSVYADYNRKTIDMVVSEARHLAIKELLPTFALGDEEGCHFDNGAVRIPDCFHRAWRLIREGDWIAMAEDPQWGGQGMPRMVALAAGDYLVGANLPFLVYASLTVGAANLVARFGTPEIKQRFLKKMYSGQWTGTMLLTEPEAGSDVGALTTMALKNTDGTYSITGSKIFISAGDHDLAENIIHPVLARIEGAPAGTSGISLFLVPKYWVEDDGRIGSRNDIICTGIEKKMGLHANATCSMALGSKGQCRGILLGEENQGMRAMFHMMNEARLLVGLQGLCCASASYINALNYARERKQGRHLLKTKDADAPLVSIIEHPDVRRQLMTMKVYVEGMRSLLYYVGGLEDRLKLSDKKQDRERYQGMVDLLIPIAKGYVTDKSFEVCNHGLQIFGGYGYIKDYPQEQLLRDCRITMIYEGTNGIQALDLLGRKLGLNGGQPLMDLLGECQHTFSEAKKYPELASHAKRLETAVNELVKVTQHIGSMAKSLKIMQAFAFAHPFMEVAGDVLMAWMLLWRATVAAQKLTLKPNKKDHHFYKGQIKSSEYFIACVLPATLGKMRAVLDANGAAVEMSVEGFGSV